MSGRLTGVPPGLNARQAEALAKLAQNQPRFSDAQRAALAAGAPTPDDILNNPEFAAELSEEIMDNYSQEAALEEVAKDRTLNINPLASAPAPLAPPVPATAPVIEARDPMKELEELERRAEAALRQQAAERASEEPAEVEEQLSPEDIRRTQILQLLASSKDAPNEAQIAAWKRQYGENGVNVIALGEGDVYVFTHLRRVQWKKIQEVVSKIAQSEQGNQSPEDMMAEKVIQFTVLYPRALPLEFFYQSRAGVVNTLYDIVMLHSYFLQPQQSMMLTTQL